MRVPVRTVQQAGWFVNATVCDGSTVDYCILRGRDFVNIQPSDFTDHPNAYTPILEVQNNDGIGTGVVAYRGKFVLTAGHVVATHEGVRSGKANWDIKVGDSAPFSSSAGASVVWVYVSNLTKQNKPKDIGRDWAVIETSAAVAIPYKYVLSNASNETLRGRSPNLKGYPGIRHGRECNLDSYRWQTKSTFGGWAAINSSVLKYKTSTASGLSGGPLATNPGTGNRYVIAAHSGYVNNFFSGYRSQGPKVPYWYDTFVYIAKQM